jgi:hypothetical protein
MITLEQFWMGRDAKYPAELSPEILHNAERLVGKVNNLLAFAEADGVAPGIDQATGNAVSSGWRPVFVNDRTRNSAAGSKHLDARAVDVQDTRDRALARWCLKNLDVLEQLGLWMEDPQWTGGADPWVHLQLVPPGSGRRVFVPSTMPPKFAKLIEQGGTA